jgi:RNA polymerase sigma-70 factor, ECF subfamily
MRPQERQKMTGEVGEIALMANSFGVTEGAEEKSSASIEGFVERAKAGDTVAFEQLINCYQRKVVSVAWRMLGNQEDARDAAQETFLKAYRYLKSFKQDQDFAGWLYRITVNACRDIARKRGAAGQFISFEVEQELGNFDSLASRDDVEASAIASQERALIATALQSLSKKEREAIVLRDLQGLPTEEVARILGSSQATVRSQICSARAKIKQFRERVLTRVKR